jgi:hypothetical protein
MTVERRGVSRLDEALSGEDALAENWEHEVTLDYLKPSRSYRAECSCGWKGPRRRGVDASGAATSDGDDHVNEQPDDVA